VYSGSNVERTVPPPDGNGNINLKLLVTFLQNSNPNGGFISRP